MPNGRAGTSGMIADEHTRGPSAQGAVHAAYRAPHEHIADLLRLHDLRLKRLIASGQPRKPDDLLGFAAISAPEVGRLLEPQAVSESSVSESTRFESGLAQLRLQIDARVERSRQGGLRLPLFELARRFHLSAGEIDVIVACLAVELDRRYERIYGFLHDDMSRRLASPGMMLGLCGPGFSDRLNLRAIFGPQAPLRYFRLLEMLEAGAAMPLSFRAMRLDERIVSFLIGHPDIDSRVAPYLVSLEADGESATLPLVSGSHEESLVRLAHWAAASKESKKPLVYLHGARNANADQLVADTARRLNVQMLNVDTERLLGAGTDFDEAIFLLFREALLGQACLYLRNFDRAMESPSGSPRYRAILNRLGEMGSILFASGEQPWSWQLPAEPVVLQVLEVRPDGVLEQMRSWQTVSNHSIADADLHRLVSLHPLPVSAIRSVWRVAQGLAAANAPEARATIDELRRACRTYTGVPASTLARQIEPRHGWNDLVLPATQLEQLAAICSQAKHSSIVYGAWRFEEKLSLGRGLNVLFCGPPGTGKTMAAEVIASDLGVPLLKIDLSQIVSKYIGETEKNLRQLFDQASSANAILFFDEADALLGKRSDVKDAHDRYANTEIAYLLQRMEEYAGIAILTTNLRQNIDAAFTRRMRFIVDFPFPEDEDRLRIWRSVWPAEVPFAEDVDLACIARQFRLSGGSIRNVALSAAFQAAEQGAPVSMHHLMHATRRELLKMGRLVNEEDHRRQDAGSQ